jgi:ribonuclease D
MPSETTFIANPDALASLVARVDTATEVAIDCEADSFHHYEEKLCLLQLTFSVGERREDAVVDPLAPAIDLRPLLEVLGRKRLFLHAGDNDLRMLGLRWEFSAREIFDTLLAAQYLGERELGLSALLERYFGVRLNKSFQRADWARRPLPAAMIEYAACDTQHLPELAALLEKRLRETGRLSWHQQACRRLAAQRPQPKPANPDSWRVKDSSELTDGERAILREVWRWRDYEARTRDQAPFRVAGNDVLLRLARVTRQSERAADGLQAARVPLSEASQRALLAALQAGLAVPKAEWPGPAERDPWSRLPRAQQARFTKLRAVRDRVAGELGLDPGLLASRSALEGLAALEAPAEADLITAGGLLPWQAELLARAVPEGPKQRTGTFS